jgi:WXXGXW repeat (2 copies)/SPOR domain
MTSIRTFAVLIGGFTLLWTGVCPSTPASAQVLERGVEGAAVGAIIGGIVGGGRGAGTGAAIGGGVGVLSGAAEANARAHGYYGPPPPGYYRPPPPDYYRPPPPAYYHRPPSAVSVSISVAPPVLPVYEQPLCPGPGYIWTPGYWAYGDVGYYWVPGTWVLPPAVGLLWTPGYWGYDGGVYVWHAGYWGLHVGYYGGINYGFGYFGTGFEGGYWKDGAFFYNTAVARVDTAVITNTYNKQAVGTVTVNHVSFNGPGGITVKPTSQEVAWSRKRHTQPTATQAKHQRAASANRALYTAVNHGTPTIAATAKPGVFNGPEVVGPKAVVATTKAAVDTDVTAPDDKARAHRQDGAAPGASEEAGPAAGQHAPGERHGPSAVAANGGVASDTGKKAFKPANMVKAPTSRTATVEPKARAILPPVTSSSSGDKPTEEPSPVQISPDESASTPSTPSSATSSGSSSSSSRSPTPASANAARSGGPMHTASLEPTINIPPGTTRFGIEIGTVEKQAGLRPLWRDILTKHPALVAGLQARRMLAPDKKWQLIAGPFGSAAEATQVCDLFKKENFKCKATAFAGDVL